MNPAAQQPMKPQFDNPILAPLQTFEHFKDFINPKPPTNIPTILYLTPQLLTIIPKIQLDLHRMDLYLDILPADPEDRV